MSDGRGEEMPEMRDADGADQGWMLLKSLGVPEQRVRAKSAVQRE